MGLPRYFSDPCWHVGMIRNYSYSRQVTDMDGLLCGETQLFAIIAAGIETREAVTRIIY